MDDCQLYRKSDKSKELGDAAILASASGNQDETNGVLREAMELSDIALGILLPYFNAEEKDLYEDNELN